MVLRLGPQYSRRGGAPAFLPLAADFDGANDYMSRGGGWTGAADANSGIFACRFRLDGGDGGFRTFWYAATDTQCYIDSSNILQFRIAGAVLSLFSSTSTLTASSSWRTLLASWDRGSATPQIYIDDASGVSVAANGTGPFDYTHANWDIGAAAAGSKFNGAVAEFYLGFGQYLDFSIEANRRKYSNADGSPVDIGSDGSGLTGSAPTAYFSVRDGDAATDFATNRGSGGNTTITGTLDLVTPSPWA